MITCRDLYDFILDYQAGELAPSQRKEFDSHLAICPSCVDYLDSYLKTVALGKAAYARTEEPASGHVPEELIRAILAARDKKA